MVLHLIWTNPPTKEFQTTFFKHYKILFIPQNLIIFPFKNAPSQCTIIENIKKTEYLSECVIKKSNPSYNFSFSANHLEPKKNSLASLATGRNYGTCQTSHMPSLIFPRRKPFRSHQIRQASLKRVHIKIQIYMEKCTSVMHWFTIFR